MRGATSQCCSTCASLGNTSARTSPARSSCRCANCPGASRSSTRRRTSWPSATMAAAASRWHCSSRRTDTTRSITSWGAWMAGRGPSIRLYRFTSACGLAAAVAAGPAAAEDLLQVYRDAQRYDAVFASARYTLEAGRERIPQGRSLLLPTVTLNANAVAQRFDIRSRDTAVTPSFGRSVQNYGYVLTFSQPVFRPQNTAQWQQSDYQVRVSEATFAQASQDLALRTAQAYFDVLTAQDTLALVGAQKAAISEQLAAAKRNFEVGTATITDTHEAHARYDLIIAQEIAAQNDLESKRRALQTVGGKEYPQLKLLLIDISLPPPNPVNMKTWVDIAERQAYSVLAQEALAEVANLEVKRQSSGHWPTLDLVGSYGTTHDT